MVDQRINKYDVNKQMNGGGGGGGGGVTEKEVNTRAQTKHKQIIYIKEKRKEKSY